MNSSTSFSLLVRPGTGISTSGRRQAGCELTDLERGLGPQQAEDPVLLEKQIILPSKIRSFCGTFPGLVLLYPGSQK